MFESVDHIAIAVADLERSIRLYTETFGVPPTHREIVGESGVEIATFALGGTAIELVTPLGPESPIQKFLDTRGPGLHHIAFRVADIEAALETLRSRGIELIDETPRRGKENSRVAFVHPRSTEKVLYELVELAT